MSDNSNAVDEIAKEKLEQSNEIKDKIKKLYTKANKTNAQAIADYIELGKSLVNGRAQIGSQLLKKTLKDIISDKQIDRYMKLVLVNGISLKEIKDEELNSKLDSKVINLTAEKLETCNQLSINKLSIMKHLKATDFDAVVKGNDTSYEAKRTELKNNADDEKAAKQKTKMNRLFKELKTDKISKEQYAEYYKEPSKAIKELVTQKENVEELTFDIELKEKKIKELEDKINQLADSFPPSETNGAWVGGLDSNALNKAQIAATS